jgi:hypothetical protein
MRSPVVPALLLMRSWSIWIGHVILFFSTFELPHLRVSAAYPDQPNYRWLLLVALPKTQIVIWTTHGRTWMLDD